MTNLTDILKKRYEGRDAFDVYDPSFLRIIESLVPDENSRSRWDFDQPATFLDLPHLSKEQWSQIDIGIIGLPIDLGATHRAGRRFGPRAVRNAESIGPYEHVLKIAPLTDLKASDLGDVQFRNRFDLQTVHKDIEDF